MSLRQVSLGEAGGRAAGDTIPAVRRPGAAAAHAPLRGPAAGAAAKVQLARAAGGKAGSGPPSRTASNASVDLEHVTHQVDELTEQVGVGNVKLARWTAILGRPEVFKPGSFELTSC